MRASQIQVEQVFLMEDTRPFDNHSGWSESLNSPDQNRKSHQGGFAVSDCGWVPSGGRVAPIVSILGETHHLGEIELPGILYGGRPWIRGLWGSLHASLKGFERERR